jgi:thymidylate synthase
MGREDGDLGPVYGVQWRSWPTPDGGHIDQIAQVVEQPQDQPRQPPHHRQRLERGRHAEDGADALPRVLPVLRGRRALSCQLYQRSADIFLGVPFNIASYALLTHMVAQQCDLAGGRLHLDRRRLPHLQQPPSSRCSCSCRARRGPIRSCTSSASRRSIFDYEYEDFEVLGYECTRPSRRRWRCRVAGAARNTERRGRKDCAEVAEEESRNFLRLLRSLCALCVRVFNNKSGCSARQASASCY